MANGLDNLEILVGSGSFDSEKRRGGSYNYQPLRPLKRLIPLEILGATDRRFPPNAGFPL
jgi:hypothetical protein